MASDYFLKIEGIDGESNDLAHQKWIELQSWSWGESNAGSGTAGGGLGSGKVSMQDFHFVSRIDKASPLLMLACATGQHIQKAQLNVRKAGGKQEIYLEIRLEDILVSSFSPNGDAENGRTTHDSLSLNFTKIEWKYRVPSTGEVVTTYFDNSPTTP